MADSGEQGGLSNDIPLSLDRQPSKRRRRRGVNYGLVIGLTVLAGLVGFAVLAITRPRISGQAFMGTPSVAAAKTCLKQGDFNCAEADYRDYLKKYPNDVRALQVLAITLTIDGQHSEAIPYYKRALSLGPGTYDLYANYALSLNNVGQVDQSMEMNRAALRIDPRLADVTGALANQLVRKGRPQEALDLLEAFDRPSEDGGQTGYFDDQVSEIKAKMGGPAAADPGSLAQASPPTPGRSEIPLTPMGGDLTTMAVVDKTLSLRFVVDSGASDVTISANVAKALMRSGQLTAADYIGQARSTIADGSIMPSRMFIIRSLRVGDREVRNVTALISNSNGPLLLGQSFFTRFKSWSIDNRRHVLVLGE